MKYLIIMLIFVLLTGCKEKLDDKQRPIYNFDEICVKGVVYYNYRLAPKFLPDGSIETCQKTEK